MRSGQAKLPDVFVAQVVVACFSLLGAGYVVHVVLGQLLAQSGRRRGRKVGAILQLVCWMSLTDILWTFKTILSKIFPDALVQTDSGCAAMISVKPL